MLWDNIIEYLNNILPDDDDELKKFMEDIVFPVL